PGGSTRIPFGDVRRNGHCGALNLRNQTVALFAWKIRRERIDALHQIHRYAPDIQLAKMRGTQVRPPRSPVPGPRSPIIATNRSNSGETSCGPGEASGCPWNENAGASVSSMPWLVPSNSERW